MAEGGAHVTSATPTSGRPSIFEVLAQESLMGAVRPALRHAVKVLAETRPAGFAWLYQYYEETYTLLDLVLQNHFLEKFGGSFSENFYGLKRVPVDDSAVPKLQPSQHRLSLLTLVIWPYIRLKLEKKYEEIEQKFSGQFPVSQESVPFVQKLYRVVFPYIHTLYEGTLLCYHMAYVFGRSECHSPLLRLCGVKLQTIGPDDDLNMNSTLQHRTRPVGVMSLALEALNYAATALSTGLSVGVFFLQFLDWWYASDHNTATLTALPVPPAPQKSDLTPAADGICPLCQRSRSNDTALSVSGYVFCYPCVYSYVRQYGQCPVTDLPCNTDHLIKLYLTQL